MSNCCWQYVKANSAVPHHVNVCSLSHIFIPLELCHECKNFLHSADPLQDPGLGYKRSLLVWVRTKPKAVAKHFSSLHEVPFSIGFPSPSACTFGVSSWEAATGAVVRVLPCVYSPGFPLWETERRRRDAFMYPAFPHLWSSLCTLTFLSLGACFNLSLLKQWHIKKLDL